MFEPLPENLSYPKLEEEVLEFWEKNGIFEKSLDKNNSDKYYVFYEHIPCFFEFICWIFRKPFITHDVCAQFNLINFLVCFLPNSS